MYYAEWAFKYLAIFISERMHAMHMPVSKSLRGYFEAFVLQGQNSKPTEVKFGRRSQPTPPWKLSSYRGGV